MGVGWAYFGLLDKVKEIIRNFEGILCVIFIS